MPIETKRNPQAGKTGCQRIGWKDLDESYLRQLILLAKEEDLAGAGLATLPAFPGDATTEALASKKTGRAGLTARVPLIPCGLALVPLVFKVYGGGCQWAPLAEDGRKVAAGTCLGTISGPVSILLQAERVALNFLQHLSGVATQTARYVEALGWCRTRLLDTRKTTPGLRVLEKYAVACGGGWNHRIGLFDRIMFKDNHLAAAGAEDNEGSRLAQAVENARNRTPGLLVEIEVDSLAQIPAVLTVKPDVILLDNFSNDDLADGLALIGNRACTEASGGITLERLASLADIGLDFISCGALIHQSCWKDISFEWQT